MPADPFLAIGMVSAPHNFERRRSVRRDMLDLPSIRNGVLVFRFLLGQVAPSEKFATPRGTFAFGSLQELQAEVAHHPDVVLLDTLDGSGEQASKQCSCLEKTVGWMQFALVQWPGASFYGKTEGLIARQRVRTHVHSYACVSRAQMTRTSNCARSSWSFVDCTSKGGGMWSMDPSTCA